MAKTDPVSIRFDTEKLALVKIKKKLETPQQVVNYLLDQFWWQNELAVTANEVRETLPYIKEDKPKTSPFEDYKAEIKGALSIAQCEAITKAAKADPILAEWQRREIENQAIQKSKHLEF